MAQTLCTQNLPRPIRQLHLLPRLLLRSEAAIQENIANPMQVYEPLKVYLMLGGKRPGGIEKASVKSWVQNDWEAVSLAGPDRADTRKRLALRVNVLALTTPGG